MLKDEYILSVIRRLIYVKQSGDNEAKSSRRVS
jgi:hypothetical protein